MYDLHVAWAKAHATAKALEPFGPNHRDPQVNEQEQGNRRGNVNQHGSVPQMCWQALRNRKQTPIDTSPSANIAGSQTLRSIEQLLSPDGELNCLCMLAIVHALLCFTLKQRLCRNFGFVFKLKCEWMLVH